MSAIPSSALASPASATTAYMSLGARPLVDPKVRAREQAVDFEAVFLNNMFSQMFTGIDGDGPFGGGGKAGVWRSFLSEEYSKSFAKQGGIGIADHVYRALLNQQEARVNGASANDVQTQGQQ
jgi:Rod binding domain-containing protein